MYQNQKWLNTSKWGGYQQKMCNKVKICQILSDGLRWPLVHIECKSDPQHKFGGNRFMGPEVWLCEYLISPIEISVNWPGSKQ